MPLWLSFIPLKIDLNMTIMNKENDIYTLSAIKWLQVTELAKKYGNDQEFGGKVRELVSNTN